MERGLLSQMLGERYVVGFEDSEVDHVVKSAGRVFRILELFDVLKREALVSEVSHLLGLPQSSTSVLLRSMVTLGYLSYSRDTRRYRPTTNVALLGSWIDSPRVSDGPLMRLLHRINARSGQAVVLAVRNQLCVQYIHVLQAVRPARHFFIVKGSRRPLVIAGAGLVLLADLADIEIKRIATRFNAEQDGGADNRISVCALMEQIGDIRNTGYAFTHDVVTQGGGVIAMRLPDVANEERLVLGLAAPSEIILRRKEEFLLMMQEEIAGYMAGPRNTVAAGPVHDAVN